MLDVSSVKGWVIMQMNARMRKIQVGENSEEGIYENREEENKQESKNTDDNERKVDPGTARNTEETQGIPLMQLYISDIFMTGITSYWAMITIEHNLTTLREMSSVRAWRESSNHGQEDKSRNMINVQLAHEKSKIEHRSSNISHPVKILFVLNQE